MLSLLEKKPFWAIATKYFIDKPMFDPGRPDIIWGGGK